MIAGKNGSTATAVVLHAHLIILHAFQQRSGLAHGQVLNVFLIRERKIKLKLFKISSPSQTPPLVSPLTVMAAHSPVTDRQMAPQSPDGWAVSTSDRLPAFQSRENVTCASESDDASTTKSIAAQMSFAMVGCLEWDKVYAFIMHSMRMFYM